jgi:hypothetical protein
VGASLAGLCAAYSAALHGATTLLIDASPEIGSRPNPATLLMEPLWRRTDLPCPRARSKGSSLACGWAALPGMGHSSACAPSTLTGAPSIARSPSGPPWPGARS